MREGERREKRENIRSEVEEEEARAGEEPYTFRHLQCRPPPSIWRSLLCTPFALFFYVFYSSSCRLNIVHIYRPCFIDHKQIFVNLIYKLLGHSSKCE